MPKPFSLNDIIPSSSVLRRDQVGRIRDIMRSDKTPKEKESAIREYARIIPEIQYISPINDEDTHLIIHTKDTSYSYPLHKISQVEVPVYNH